MGAALFYHLTRSAPEQLLLQLIGKSRDAGWRVELRSPDRPRAETLDQRLWTAAEFLPHGLSGGPHDAMQPVLLTTAGTGADDGAGAAAANQPQCLITLDGAGIAPSEAAGLERICILFDGNDPAAVEHARGQWRALTGAGVAAEYWSEADGRWQKKP
ncbi:DNA polymerase III subunit chi [Paracoccus pacificus]|uniref:DNA polymerase III subunit chi n=1 Tax=Paracoccus pacificus TaxID=1463598 RepID=A0ABW4R8M9_9RHOB